MSSLYIIMNLVFCSLHSLQAFGFMALVAFLVDLILFYKTKGFPFQKGGKAQSSNGVGAEVPDTLPETERLNDVTQ